MLFDEELKCLFLRSRDPKIVIFKQLVVKVFDLKLYKNEAKTLVSFASKRFCDYRNKYNDVICSLVEQLRNSGR